MFVFPFPLRDGVGAEANIEAFPLNRSNVLERTATDILMKLESVALYVLHRRVVKHPRFSRISPLSLATKVQPSAGRCTPPIVVTSCLRVSWRQLVTTIGGVHRP